MAQWDQLRDLFHADGTIEVTWFEGNANDFIDASMRMGDSDLRTKHCVARHPREYAPLAYLLEKSGFPVDRVFATKGSALESAMKAEGKEWLGS